MFNNSCFILEFIVLERKKILLYLFGKVCSYCYRIVIFVFNEIWILLCNNCIYSFNSKFIDESYLNYICTYMIV